MNPDNETYTAFPEKPHELPEKIVPFLTTQPAIPDETPQQVTGPIADLPQDSYTDAINNLVAKYKK
ncbi:MAG: hypothetical protein ABIQ31_02770 [Ferruginibacter sp.]